MLSQSKRMVVICFVRLVRGIFGEGGGVVIDGMWVTRRMKRGEVENEPWVPW